MLAAQAAYKFCRAEELIFLSTSLPVIQFSIFIFQFSIIISQFSILNFQLILIFPVAFPTARIISTVGTNLIASLISLVQRNTKNESP